MFNTVCCFATQCGLSCCEPPTGGLSAWLLQGASLQLRVSGRSTQSLPGMPKWWWCTHLVSDIAWPAPSIAPQTSRLHAWMPQLHPDCPRRSVHCSEPIAHVDVECNQHAGAVLSHRLCLAQSGWAVRRPSHGAVPTPRYYKFLCLHQCRPSVDVMGYEAVWMCWTQWVLLGLIPFAPKNTAQGRSLWWVRLCCDAHMPWAKAKYRAPWRFLQ